jgi:hypothetical protein
MARGSSFGLTVLLAGASCAWGQSAISAHSGMIHYVEGKVLLEGQPVEPKFGEFPEVKNDQVLETAEGRAEVLMTPGVFLRLAENSSFKMLSNRLSDTAIEVLSGSTILEVDQLMKDNAITIRYKDATIALSKEGLYRVDADSNKLRVYDGEASVTYGIKTVQLHKGKQVDLNETLLASTFDTKDTDAFYRWVSRRSEYIAAANVSSARAAGNGGLNASASVPCIGQASTTPNPSSLATGNSTYCNPYGNPGGYGAYGPGYGYSPYGSWAWNPYYGMFTYLPGIGYGYSPFGWSIYSPSTVGSVYVPGAYRGTGTTSVLSNRGSGPTALAGATRSTGSSATATATTALRAGGSGTSGASTASSGQARAASGSSSMGGGGASAGGASGGGGRGGGGGGGGHR